ENFRFPTYSIVQVRVSDRARRFFFVSFAVWQIWINFVSDLKLLGLVKQTIDNEINTYFSYGGKRDRRNK
ncbi:MAG: hypothetical protein K2G01_09130, partial [Paramuribaculum sp.]|nr:hypothetical protein [Paramuribaculum sp.]